MFRSLAILLVTILLSSCGDPAVVNGTTDETTANPEAIAEAEATARAVALLTDRDLMFPPDIEDEEPAIGAALAWQETIDLARGKTVIQSTTDYGGIAGRAVDGNVSGIYAEESVTSTSNQLHPWWQVDLAQNYNLARLLIWNRSDCCADRLANFYIFVADHDMRDRSLDDLKADPTVWHQHHVPAVAAGGVMQAGIAATGRYVRIQKAETGILSLAEVKVFGANLAEGGMAKQASTAHGGIASRAVDGTTNGNYNTGSVTHTAEEAEPWWQVDLGEQVSIGKMRLFNRTDCCRERLSHFYVFVSETDMGQRSISSLVNDPLVWKSFEVAGAGGYYIVSGQSKGRYVRVQRNTPGFLSLAEVAVYGAAVNTKVYGTNLAEGKPATQSTTGFGAVASRATDGNTAGVFNDLSVTSTNQQAEPWWQVDLENLEDFENIVLHNRIDCCSERLSNFRVFVSDTDMSERNINSLVNDPQVWKTDVIAAAGARPYSITGQNRGRFIRVQLTGTGYLSLAEVEVFKEPIYEIQDNDPNPALYGEWSDPVEWPHIAVHAGLLPSGKIISYDATPDDFLPVLDPVASPNDTTRASLWDYVTGIHQDAANNLGDDLFCSGHSLMSDGNLFVAAGTQGYNGGVKVTNIFNYQDEIWEPGPEMDLYRWYPTVTNMANGELMIAGGFGRYPEIYNPQTRSLRTLNGDSMELTNTSWPFIMQAPNGKMLYAGGAGAVPYGLIDTAGNGSLTVTSTHEDDRNRGSFVVYDTNKMLITGGTGGRKTTRIVTMNTAQAVAANPMHLPRQDHNTLALPDGTVIVVGGNQGGGFCNDHLGSYAPEIWNPASNQWTLLAAQQHPRQYHSTAILLPDARVWSGGQGYATVVSTQTALCSYQNNAEIFSPPYLYNEDGSLADRPVIVAAPEAIQHGQAFNVDTDDASSIQSASLIRLSTATHATNFSQRFVPLVFRNGDNNRLSIDAPINPNVALPGYYMLFLVNQQGTPSVAKMIKVGDTTIGGLTYTLDFGTDASPLEPGAIKVTPDTDTSLVNWSLSKPQAVDRGPVNNGNRLDRDLVFNRRESQLNVNVGNGVWRVTMGIGDTAGHLHDNVLISAEGAPVHNNLSTSGPDIVYIGNNEESLDDSTSFDVAVTDGTLTINLFDQGGSNPDWVLNNMKIELRENVSIPAPVIEPPTIQPQQSGTSVQLSTQATGLGTLLYSWNFGDGTPATAFAANQAQVNHVYQQPGRYVVTLAVRDSSNITSTDSFTQIIYAAPTATQPVKSTSIIEHAANNQVWVVNPDNNSVTVVSTTSVAVADQIDVGENPVSVAVAPDGQVWVVNKNSSSISVIDPASLAVVQTIQLSFGAAPHGIVFSQSNAIVALEASSKIISLSTTNGAIEDEIAVAHRPRHLAMNADGSRLYATVFITPPLPNEHTLSPVVDGSHGGRVLVLNAAPLQSLPDIVLQYSDAPQADRSGPGIPNYLGGFALSPDGTFAWTPSKQDNILNGELRSGVSLRFDQAVRSISSRIDLTSQTEILAARIDHDNASVTSQAVFDNLGTYLFTTLEGNRQVAVNDANANKELFRFDVGRAPQGLTVSADNTRLYVHNFMDRSVGVYNIAELTSGLSISVNEVAVVSTVSNERLTPEVLQGKKLFYDAQDDRLAGQDYMSCASCHNEGGHDGRVWDFSQAGEGLRNTSTLKGRGGPEHGFLHWSANFDEVQDFEAQIREFAGGTGLMSNAQFNTGTRAQPLGDAKAGISPDLDAVAAYVNSLTTAPESPHRTTNASTTQGQALFTSKNCVSCHAGSQFTDSGDGSAMHDIGTIKSTSGQRLSAALNGIDTPGLLGAWATAPYLHDGSAATIEDAIGAHASISTSAADRTALADYIRTLPGGPAAAIPLATNELINGDFEQGKDSWLDCGTANLTATIADSFDGSNAMQVQNTGCIYQEFPVIAGTDYQLLCLAKVTDGQFVSITLQMADATYTVLGQTELPIDSATYQAYSTSMTAPSNSAVGVVTLYSEGTGIFDSCSVVSNAAPPPPPPVATNNKLDNGGFEQGKTSWSDCSAATLNTLSLDSFAGTGAVQVQNAGCLYQEFPVSAGASYQFVCYAKSAGTQYSSITLQIVDAAYTQLDAIETPVTGNTYQQFQSTIEAPANSAIGSVTLYSDDTAHYDSCSVVEI